MFAALAGVMGIVGAVGSVMQGRAERAIADLNAGTEEQNAAQARYAAREEASIIRMRSAYTVGSMKATVGATGIYVNSGTNVDKIADTEAQYEHDALKALYSGEIQATAFERQANIYRYSGKVAQRQSYYQAGFGLASQGLNAYTATQYGYIPGSSNLPSVMATGNTGYSNQPPQVSR